MKTKLFLFFLLAFVLIACVTTANGGNHEFSNYIGISDNELIKIFGEDCFQNTVDSTSAKTKMPGYLADYLMAEDKIVEAKVLSWKKGRVHLEFVLKKENDQWIVFGYSVYELK